MSFFLSDRFKDKKVDERFIKKKHDFTREKPGTPEWMAIWKERPDLQEAMLKFQSENFPKEGRYIYCEHYRYRVAIEACRARQKIGKKYCIDCYEVQ